MKVNTNRYEGYIMFDMNKIEELTGLQITDSQLIDQRNLTNDIRYIYQIVTNVGDLVLKIEHNSFTSIHRVNQTAKLVEAYNQLHIYAPTYLKLANNMYSACIEHDNVEYILWVEEMAKYDSHILKEDIRSIQFQKQKASMIGIVADGLKNHPFDYPSPYIMYEPFDDDSQVDEYTEYLEKVYHELYENDAIDKYVLQYVYSFFYDKRNQIKKKYLTIPSSVFQNDMQKENLLLKDSTLIGLMDFNLAGREKVLTYFINEMAYQEDNPIGEEWISDRYITHHVNQFTQYLRVFQQYYTLSNTEKDILEDLYKVIIPYKYYPLTEILGYSKLKQYDEVNYRLLWMKRIIDSKFDFLTKKSIY